MGLGAEFCPSSAPFFGFMGAAVALIFASAPPPLCSSINPPTASGAAVPCRGASGGQRLAPRLEAPRPRPARRPPPHTASSAHADLGAAYGTAKSGVGVSSMGVMKPDLVMKSIIPVVMAGVLGIYGLIIAVIIGSSIKPPTSTGAVYTSFAGFAHLSSGLACGLSGMAAGIAIGIVGDAGVRAAAQQSKLYVGMVLILIFAEALGLYGLIVGLILSSKGGSAVCGE